MDEKKHPLFTFLADDRFVRSIGIELMEVGEGTAMAQMEITPGHTNAAGNVQGGVLFTLADFTLAAAANSYMRIAVTLRADITYLKPVSQGMVYARAKEISLGHKISTYQVEIIDEQGEMLALFTGTAYRKEQRIEIK